jgi:hypothetical protein
MDKSTENPIYRIAIAALSMLFAQRVIEFRCS